MPLISPSLAGKPPKPVRSLPAEGRLISSIHRGLTTLLVLLIAYSAADLTWGLVALTRQPGKSPLPAPALSVPTAQEAVGSRSAPATLAGLHLFGQARQTVTTSPPATSETIAHPQTSLQVLLIGVFVSSSPRQSLAIIAEKGKKGSEAIYGEGDQLPGNAKLSEIRTDRVILLRAGRYETLPLDVPPTSKNGMTDKAETGAPGEGSGEAARTSSNRTQMTIDRQRWERELSDLPALANEVGVEPFPPVGKQQGYRLLAKGDGRVLSDLGLLAGDIVVEVNGLSLKDPSTALQAYARIKEAEAITVRLIRDGRQETKEFTITGDAASP